MDFLFITTQELSALADLPLIQRVTYLMGIRPYMDNQTGIVGIKRKISYQSLREVLYVAPIAGVKTGSPSFQQVRRSVQALDRVGLIAIQSADKHLILKCLFVDTDKNNQKQAGIRPAPQADMRLVGENSIESMGCKVIHRQAGTGQMAQAGTPHNSRDNYLLYYAKFEKFWLLYPEKKGKKAAWLAFQRISPDEQLYKAIIQAVEAQVKHREYMHQNGLWIPEWKYPANWLDKRCWEDELTMNMTKEGSRANRRRTSKESTRDMFWLPDKPEPASDAIGSNIIEFKRS